jgi:hypothetical protein
MSADKPTMTAYIGDPSALKKHSMAEIEAALAEALSKLIGEQIDISINNLQILDPSVHEAVSGAQPKVSFDVCVRSKTAQVENPFSF